MIVQDTTEYLTLFKDSMQYEKMGTETHNCKHYISSVMRHNITILGRILSLCAPSFVTIPLSHVYEHRGRQKERTLSTTLSSHCACVRGLTEQEWVQHIQIQHDCQCNCPRYDGFLSASLAYHSIHINSLSKSTWKELKWLTHCMLNFLSSIVLRWKKRVVETMSFFATFTFISFSFACQGAEKFSIKRLNANTD